MITIPHFHQTTPGPGPAIDSRSDYSAFTQDFVANFPLSTSPQGVPPWREVPPLRRPEVRLEGIRRAEKVSSIGHLGQSAEISLPGLNPHRPDPSQHPGRHPGYLQPAATSKTILHLRSLILERFPVGSPAIVLFLGSENNPHTHSTCNAVAASVAEQLQGQGRVLLVDSCPQRKLSRAFQKLESPGISNCLAPTALWQNSVISRGAGLMDFLPAGTSHWEHWGAETRLLQIAAQARQRYPFVFVNAGDAHHSMGKLWSSVCDGSYLLVSMKSSNADIAESAVTELQASGARLLGCIATDFSG
jgi:hypothetical protein